MGGDVLQPAGSSSASSQSKMLTGDLDSSLANLASNLDFGNGAKKNIMQSGARGPPMTQGFGAFPGQQAQPQMGLLSPSDESNFAFPSSPSPSSNSSFIPQSSSHPSSPPRTTPSPPLVLLLHLRHHSSTPLLLVQLDLIPLAALPSLKLPTTAPLFLLL